MTPRSKRKTHAVCICCDWLKTQIALFVSRDECLKTLGENESFIEPFVSAKVGYSCGKDEDKPAMFFMYFDRLYSSDRSLAGLIAHECVHLVDFLFEYKGIETRSVNSEAKAYMIEWLFCECSKNLETDRFGLIYLKGSK